MTACVSGETRIASGEPQSDDKLDGLKTGGYWNDFMAVGSSSSISKIV